MSPETTPSKAISLKTRSETRVVAGCCGADLGVCSCSCSMKESFASLQ